VWVERARRAGITNLLVGAADEALLVALARRRVHTFSMKAGVWVAQVCVG
jgi:hypothetical protein